jgi:predicted NBD/HSP70 family sugar kinase
MQSGFKPGNPKSLMMAYYTLNGCCCYTAFEVRYIKLYLQAKENYMKGNNTTILKKANRYLIITSIRHCETVTIENLMNFTGLSRPTVRNILDELLEINLVEIVGFEKTEIGRQPTLYQLNRKSNYAIGIDVEITPVRLMFTNLGGDIVFSKKWRQDGGSGEDDFFERIANVINEGMQNLSITSDNVIGIGMGIPGLIDMHQNIINHIPRFQNIRESQLAKRIEDELGMRVYLCNDVKLLAVADSQVLNSKADNILYIAYRAGIGMAILHKNTIYDGEYGNSGYLGHTTINPDGELCSCGNRGCLELYCSRSVLLNRYNNKSSTAASISEFDTLLKLADDGNADARAVLGAGGHYLGVAIANAMKLFDISMVIIGNLCSSRNSYYFQAIQQAVKTCMTHTNKNKITFLLGSNIEDNFAIGGCKYVIEKFFKEPKLRLDNSLTS